MRKVFGTEMLNFLNKIINGEVKSVCGILKNGLSEQFVCCLQLILKMCLIIYIYFDVEKGLNYSYNYSCALPVIYNK